MSSRGVGFRLGDEHPSPRRTRNLSDHLPSDDSAARPAQEWSQQALQQQEQHQLMLQQQLQQQQIHQGQLAFQAGSPGGTLAPAPTFNHPDTFQTGLTEVAVPLDDLQSDEDSPIREDIFRQD